MKVIAIDGPAGAGKSTIARTVARRLGWTYLDTGALYRAAALASLDAAVDLDDGDAVASIVRSRVISVDATCVRLDGADVTSRIRDPDVTEAATRVSAHPEVRAALVDSQREAATKGRIVMEGRDIGTSVVPDARLKIFLYASLEERARRRLRQTGGRETPAELKRTAEAIATRDKSDSSRRASPLLRAPDAIVIDSTDKNTDEVTDAIVAAARRVFDEE